MCFSMLTVPISSYGLAIILGASLFLCSFLVFSCLMLCFVGNCRGWKAKVNEWVNDGGPIVGKECKINVLFTAQFLFCSWSIWSLLKQFTDHTPQSVDASCLDQEEGGLPSPPMDEAALFATPCTSIQLSEVSDIETSVVVFTSSSMVTVVLTNLDPFLVLETCFGFEVLR